MTGLTFVGSKEPSGTTEEGSIYYDKSTKQMKMFTNGSWKVFDGGMDHSYQDDFPENDYISQEDFKEKKTAFIWELELGTYFKHSDEVYLKTTDYSIKAGNNSNFYYCLHINSDKEHAIDAYSSVAYYEPTTEESIKAVPFLN